MLSNKVIFLLSPDKWGKIHISKHNYAKALAERGNKVFFFNPIDESLAKGKIVVNNTEIDGVIQVNYNPPFPIFLKFKLPGLFFRLMNVLIRRFRKILGVKPDIIWDFTIHPLFSDLRKFGADIRILHPVDGSPAKRIEHRNAHIAFSVSPDILDTIDKPELPKYFVNHGLSSQFTDGHQNAVARKGDEAVNVGYVGNLLIHSLDYGLFYDVIDQNPRVNFHLIGPYDRNNQLLVTELKEAWDFVEKVKSLPNVRLYGAKGSAEVTELINSFDAFIICYKMTEFYRCDNSHKILEFLSTGKVVITNPIAAYKDSDLIVTNRKNDHSGFLQVFREVITNLDVYNAPDRCTKRIAFAKEHSYQRNIDKIENYILENVIKQDRN